MIYTDKRAQSIAQASAELEALKRSLTTDGSLSSEGLQNILSAISTANEAVQTAQAMDQHTYESFFGPMDNEGNYTSFQGADRTVITVSSIITHDVDGNVLQELRFNPPRYIILSASDTADIDPVKYLTNRWQQ